MSNLEQEFAPFRQDIVGVDLAIPTLEGEKPLTYLDFTAMGRLTKSVLEQEARVAPYLGNTHTSATFVGRFSSELYHRSSQKIAEHVNASAGDVVLFKGSGSTAAICWFQEMLFLKAWECEFGPAPVVINSRMEHHSNDISWRHTDASHAYVNKGADGLPDLNHLETLCIEIAASGRPILASFTACSNVTGIVTPYHEMARIVHNHGGKCFFDFSAGLPYMQVDMHPSDPAQALDAIFYSPHKCLGGPGASGVVVFDSALYRRKIPVDPGGGTVIWVNPFEEESFIPDIVVREDGGTPPVLQGYRAALAFGLKEKMQPERMAARKEEILEVVFSELANIPGIHILEERHRKRQATVSFVHDSLHYMLIVQALSDVFGIQVRGGCSCAGVYGHDLFKIDQEKSNFITKQLDAGNCINKPGWVRASFHPTTTDQEVHSFVSALKTICEQPAKFRDMYDYNAWSNEFKLKTRYGAVPPTPNVDDFFL